MENVNHQEDHSPRVILRNWQHRLLHVELHEALKLELPIVLLRD